MEPLKYLYTAQFIKTLANAIKKEHKPFKQKDFENFIQDSTWQSLELKQRMRRITHSLQKYLPYDYRKALNILLNIAPHFKGLTAMSFPEFVEIYGQHDFEASLPALKELTKYSSSEFAIRPFIVKNQKKTLKQMAIWAKSKNEHVRRLASEGCRPRLPWAISLPSFIIDPDPIIEILTTLKADSSLYVRKSVANNINDISKDHPEKAFKLISDWHGQSKETDWICNHAARTLLKKGDLKTMKVFGFQTIQNIKISNFKIDPTVKKGHSIHFSFQLKNTSNQDSSLRIEYSIEFVRLNNKTNQKVFMLNKTILSEEPKNFSKCHSFKPISTRKYYPGLHKIRILVNGQEIKKAPFHLVD